MDNKTRVLSLLGGLDSHLRNHLTLLDSQSPNDVLKKFRVLKFESEKLNASTCAVLAIMQSKRMRALVATCKEAKNCVNDPPLRMLSTQKQCKKSRKCAP